MMVRLLLALAPLLLAACTASPPCRTHTALFLGTAIGEQGRVVSEAEWQLFVAEEVAARFPDGFSVVEAIGQYRSPATGNVMSEKTRILTLLHADAPVAHRAIDAIAAAYKIRFRQESVLRVDQCAAFAF